MIGPRACYDEGKRCAETLFFDYHRQHKVPIKVIRIFNTYGPRMHPNDGRVVSNFIMQALRGEPITLYGDGSQTRAFCHVDDLVQGMIGFMDHSTAGTGPINLGNPVEFSIRHLAEEVLRLTGSASRIEFRPLPQDDPRQRRPDISKAQAVLGWEPTIPLAAGLLQTIEDFRRRYFNPVPRAAARGQRAGMVRPGGGKAVPRGMPPLPGMTGGTWRL